MQLEVTQESARLSGINIEMVKTMVFVISGALCGIAGVLLTAKVRSGDPTCANAWEMDTIAGAIIGGTDMNGGEGKLGGTIIGSVRRYPCKWYGTPRSKCLYAERY